MTEEGGRVEGDTRVELEESEQGENEDSNSDDSNINNSTNVKIEMTLQQPQRPYMAIGIVKKGDCDFQGGKKSVCTNTMKKHELDTSASRRKIPQYGLHSRM